MTHSLLLFAALGLTVLTVPALGGTPEQAPLHYRLKVKIDPARHRLEAEAWLTRPPTSRFYLHESLSVRQVIADGKAVRFHRDEAAEPLPYTRVTRPVVVEAEGVRQLYAKYDGEMSEVINDVNMITPDLVELAYYSAWYPVFPGMAPCTFELETATPASFLVTTNGALKGRREHEGRVITTWKSYASGFDIVLLASPNLNTLEGKAGDLRVEMFYSKLSPEFMRGLTDGLVKGINRLAQAYGPPAVRGVLRLVCSPRGGWGYSRSPLFVVPEELAQADLSTANGQARQFHGYSHEMAHFWWLVADTGTPDDWLNEGPAEYSAYCLSEVHDGPAFAQTLVQEYQQHADASSTSAAIAETETSSPDRYVNRYEKATLMFLEARRRFGEKALDEALRSFHTRFAKSQNATTALFLAEMRTSLGEEGQAFFREAVYRKGVVTQPATQTP